MDTNQEMMSSREEQQWQAVLDRDGGQDGAFLYGVLTTGVYCKPSCPSRRPRRENVRFYTTQQEAERDGLRPCRRCRPLENGADEPKAARIRELCAHIDAHCDEPLPLADLAARAGLSPFHLQRQFKAVVGLTPRQYQESRRLNVLKTRLRAGSDVTGAIYDAGFGSSSRVYERADTRLGMTPGEYRSGANGIAITYVAVQSPVGLMMIGATDRGLCFIQFGESEQQLLGMLQQEYPLAQLTPMPEPYPEPFIRWMEALSGHLEGTQPQLSLPLDIRATAFQMSVWQYLQTIPYGQVQSYGEVAAALGQPKSVRAVARACASNRVALVIPCHRVIRGTGELGGYRWGLARKRTLIDRERTSRAAAKV